MLRSLNLFHKPSLRSNINLKRSKCLTIENVNPKIKRMFLMNDDKVYLKYLQLKKELKENPDCVPFKEIIEGNSGDLHDNFAYITFIRQIAAAAIYPSLTNDDTFPDDVKCKARDVIKNLKSVGVYTASPGLDLFREEMAKYLTQRDCIPCDYNDIFFNSGITEGIRNILRIVSHCNPKKPLGALVATPSFPYGLLEEYGFVLIRYDLEEELNWSPCINKLEDKLESAKEECDPRIMIVINPGNPTGAVWKCEQMRDIIKFAYDKKLLIIADEAYQEIVYNGKSFLSFKKVMHDMERPYSDMELVSCSGISQGFTGEAGLRAGFTEIINFDKEVIKEFHKSISVNLCACTVGQIMQYAMANHPEQGDDSYKLWKAETECIKKKLESQAKTLVDLLNKVEGFSCKPVEGGYFAYPKITVPNKAAEEAKQNCVGISTFYGLKLLEETGVLVTPGDVFGEDKTPHIRISILPTKEKITEIVQKINEFNKKFLEKYK